LWNQQRNTFKGSYGNLVEEAKKPLEKKKKVKAVPGTVRNMEVRLCSRGVYQVARRLDHTTKKDK